MQEPVGSCRSLLEASASTCVAALGARAFLKLRTEHKGDLGLRIYEFITHRPQSSSFLGLPYRTLNMNPKKELLWGLWVP